MLSLGFAGVSARYEEVDKHKKTTITFMMPIMSDQIKTDVWVLGATIVVVDTVYSPQAAGN